MTWKRAALGAITHPSIAPVLRLLGAGRSTILTLHRFSNEHSEAGKLSDTALRAQLAYLRKQGYSLVPLLSMIEDLAAGKLPAKNSVSFTVDDGYADFRDIAAPVFGEFDCPVTLFVATGPVDRKVWFWWNRIEFAFEHTKARHLKLTVASETLSYHWVTRHEARSAAADFAKRLTRVSQQARLDGIERVCSALEVDTSGPAPSEYATIAWHDLRRLVGTGLVHAAPHTVTHPILSRLSPREMSWEIHESWQRLRTEVPTAVPIFCYPNGAPLDYTGETIAAIRSAGLIAAVTTQAGHVRPLDGDSDDCYHLPRFSCPDDVPHLAQVVTGIEAMKLAFKHGHPSTARLT